MLDKVTAQNGLADLIGIIETLDDAERYDERNAAVVLCVGYAMRAGYEAGFRIDEEEPAWPVAFIELPTGQVSWHLPEFPLEWDGHQREEKYLRVKEFVSGLRHLTRD
jgi:hypothetical protein